MTIYKQPGSPYYYYDFYMNPSSGLPQPHKMSDVAFPASKSISPCLGCPAPRVFSALSPPPQYSLTDHGPGLNLLFVDGHAQFARWIILNRDTLSGGYNFDWTLNGLTGKDLN